MATADRRNDILRLLLESRRVLRFSQEKLAIAVRSSTRTVARWEAGQAIVWPHYLKRLAAHLYPRDRQLARRAAELAGTTLEALGLEIPEPAPAPVPEPVVEPPPPPPPALPLRPRVEAVLLAAILTLEGPPAGTPTSKVARAVLAAAFARASELELTAAEVAQGLAPEDARPARTARRAAPRRATGRG